MLSLLALPAALFLIAAGAPVIDVHHIVAMALFYIAVFLPLYAAVRRGLLPLRRGRSLLRQLELRFPMLPVSMALYLDSNGILAGPAWTLLCMYVVSGATADGFWLGAVARGRGLSLRRTLHLAFVSRPEETPR